MIWNLILMHCILPERLMLRVPTRSAAIMTIDRASLCDLSGNFSDRSHINAHIFTMLH